MKKSWVIVLLAIVLLSISFVSAFWITGDVSKVSSEKDIRPSVSGSSGGVSSGGLTSNTATIGSVSSGPAGVWTEWYNRDGPDGTGDWETLTDLKKANPEICNDPLQVQCQTTTGLDYTQTGEVVTCAPDKGAICINSQQPDGECDYNYQVRFNCVPSVPTITPLTPGVAQPVDQVPTLPTPSPTPIDQIPTLEEPLPTPVGQVPMPEEGVDTFNTVFDNNLYLCQDVEIGTLGPAPDISIGLDNGRSADVDLGYVTVPEFTFINGATYRCIYVGPYVDVEEPLQTFESYCIDGGCVIYEGDSANANINGDSYEVSISYLGKERASLEINGKETNNVREGESDSVNGLVVLVSDVVYYSRDAGVSYVEVVLTKEEEFSCGVSGCELNNECYAFGYRTSINFCDPLSSEFTRQLANGASCSENFECRSDLCVSNQCISQGFWSEFGDWLGDLFRARSIETFNVFLDDNLYECQDVEKERLGEAPEISTGLGSDGSTDFDLGYVAIPEFTLSDGRDYRCVLVEPEPVFAEPAVVVDMFSAIFDNNLYQCQNVEIGVLGAPEISTGLGFDSSADVDLGNVAVPEFTVAGEEKTYSCVFISPLIEPKIKCNPVTGDCFNCLDSRGNKLDFIQDPLPGQGSCPGDLTPISESKADCRDGECYYCIHGGEIIDFPKQGPCPGLALTVNNVFGLNEIINGESA